MTYQKLERFPLGDVRAEGFLREQCERCREGIGGHLPDLEPEMIRDPFLDKKPVPAWAGGDQDGWGAEISGNYWSGFIQLAFVLGDEEMIRKATDFVDAVLKKVQPDGYLGTYTGPDAFIHEDYNAWGTSCLLRGLIAFYEATGRKDVLDAVHNCLLWFVKNWAGDQKTSYAGPYLIEPLVFTYYYTKDETLIRFAEEYSDYLCAHDLFDISYRAMLSLPLRFNSNHTAAVGINSRLPALLYTVTGKREYLDATVRRLGQVRDKAMNLSGGPVSVTEFLGPVGATTETEYCSFAFFNAAYSYMSFITGEARYGDFMEEMFYNGAEGARKKDERAIAYLSAPNQVYATTRSSISDDMQVYAPCYPVSCCPVNAVAVLPEFIRGMFLHDKEKNVYATCYGPCRLHSDGVEIVEETLYPFRRTVNFRMVSGGKYTFYLKTPGWSKSVTVEKNGKPMPLGAAENGYFPVGSEWNPGDVITVSFGAEVEILHVDDRYKENKKPLALRYGPLLFSYHIPEEWRAIPGTPMTPLPDGWSWFNVYPVPDPGNDAKDPHERLGRKKWFTSWSVALDEDTKPEEVTVEETEPQGYVWQDPPIRLRLRAYHAPYLFPPYPQWTYEPSEAYNFVSHEKEITLVPFGCTNLRITYFPKADMSTLKK